MFECISHNLRADVSTVSSRRVWADPCGLGSKVHRRFQQDYDISYVVYVLYFLYPEMAPEGAKSCRLMYHAIMCQHKNRLPSSNSDLPPKLPNHPVRHCAAWQWDRVEFGGTRRCNVCTVQKCCLQKLYILSPSKLQEAYLQIKPSAFPWAATVHLPLLRWLAGGGFQMCCIESDMPHHTTSMQAIDAAD